MIGLEVQIQLLVFSFLFGMLFSAVYSLFNFITYKTFKPLRLLLEAPLFIIFTVCYFYLNYKIGEGILNIYYLLFLGLGLLIYQSFYAPLILKFASRIKKYLKRKLFDKINLKLLSFYDIIKKKWGKKNGKIRKSTANKMEQKPGDHDTFTWNIPPATSIHDQ